MTMVMFIITVGSTPPRPMTDTSFLDELEKYGFIARLYQKT
jgi:hypothetical protein